MTQLLDSDITKFKTLYKKHFDIELDDFEARDKLFKLVRMLEIVYQPITKQQLIGLLERDYVSKRKSSKSK